jgi:hypothetical protein
VDFTDVPLDSFHDSVDTAASYGAMSGCGTGTFCPTTPVTRAQMAGYLLRSEHSGIYYPPPPVGIFSDVPTSSPDATWIEQLYNEAITAGCGGSNYCPGSPVTRAQMAVFLLKTEWGPSYTPPSCAGVFAVVPCPGPFTDWVEQLYHENVTAGCGGSNFCPSANVQQNQMAVFLVKLFALVNPAAIWFLDDSVPGAATTWDYSGNGDTGSVSGTIVDQGVAGYSRKFASNLNDWIFSNTTPSLNIAGSITVEAWVKPSSAANNRILNKSPNLGSPSSYPGNFDLYLDSSGHVWFRHEAASGPISYSSSGTVPLNVWTHVAVTWGRGRVKFYINGSLNTDLADAAETALTNSSVLRIGRRAGATKYDGNIDEVRIWPYARTARQIALGYIPETNCYKANPNDLLTDDAALQACLDKGGEIRLVSGATGSAAYVISSPLRVTKNFTVIVGVAPPARPKLIAAVGLQGSLLNVYQLGGLVGAKIGWLDFDGNRSHRVPIIGNGCMSGGWHGGNLSFGRHWTTSDFAEITNFAFDDNVSENALCGSGAEIYGTDYEVARNSFLSNGVGTENPINDNCGASTACQWSDGLTLARCINGTARDNLIIDGTDIDLVYGGGINCQITTNNIQNVNRHAFAGLSAASFCFPGSCTSTGAVMSGNTVTSTAGMMSLGLSLGPHPWGFPPDLRNKGTTVTANSVSGAIVNVQVDGVDQLTFTGNTIGVRQGTAGCGPSTPPSYAVNSAHASNSTLQAGWTEQSYDNCIP